MFKKNSKNNFYKHYLIHSFQQPSKVGNNIISILQMKNLSEIVILHKWTTKKYFI